jgi:hypothetical protein
MKKIPKNQKGFTAVEGLLIILILVVIGGVGYMVYHNNHKTKTVAASTTAAKTKTSSTKTATNPYSGWKTYTGSQVSFQYPSSWTVSTNANPAVGVSVTSPIFTSSSAGVSNSSGYGSTVSMLAQIGTTNGSDYCSGSSCQVTAVVPLSNSQLKGDVLAVVNQTVNGTSSSDTTFVVANGNTKVGDTDVTQAGASDGLYVNGQTEYNSPSMESTVTAPVSNVTELKTNSYFTNLVSLINGMKFN